MDDYKTILSKINYGGVELKNRVIFAPTTLGLSNKKYFKFIENLAKGDVAMIIIGDVPVDNSKFTPSLFTKKGFKFYTNICNIAHQYNCKVCAQLHMSDTNMKKIMFAMPKIMSKKLSSEEKLNLMNNITSDYISNIPAEKVKEITASFTKAAELSIKAGFDILQVHGDRMCGSFSSTIFNKRTDFYGGNVVNRARFAVESIKAIREKFPNIPIDYKLAIRQENPHYGNAGILFEEIKDFVPLLEKAGVTSFHVAQANHSKLEDAIPPVSHPYFKEEGCFLKYVKEVRKYTNLPITGVGCLSHPDFIESKINDGTIDCVSMSRQLIADPNYVKKIEEGNAKNISYCLRCNKGCFGGLMSHKGVSCILNK